MKILLVENDIHLAEVIKVGLVEEGYAVDAVYDGNDGEMYLENNNYDLLILDILALNKDGVHVCKSIRNKGVNTPVLMLTVPNKVGVKVTRSDLGADDYIVKPFTLSELLERVQSLLEPKRLEDTPKLIAGDLKIDKVSRDVFYKNEPIKLTNKQFSILEYFIRHPDKVISREILKNYAWDYDYAEKSNTVDVFILRLRHKIDNYGCSIRTEIGKGYRLEINSVN
jgi:DNA-binding response OmpR family regulator